MEFGPFGQSGGTELVEFGIEVALEVEHDGYDRQVGTTKSWLMRVDRWCAGFTSGRKRVGAFGIAGATVGDIR